MSTSLLDNLRESNGFRRDHEGSFIGLYLRWNASMFKIRQAFSGFSVINFENSSIPQKQGAEQSVDTPNRAFIISLAFSGSKVFNGVIVIVGIIVSVGSRSTVTSGVCVNDDTGIGLSVEVEEMTAGNGICSTWVGFMVKAAGIHPARANAMIKIRKSQGIVFIE